MHWGQIKTLFIACFLILDIYLLFQFIDKQRDADLRVLESQDTSVEEQFATENIKVADLPDEEYNETYITVRQKVLNEDDKKDLSRLGNQKSTAVDNKFILSAFNKPVPVPEDAKHEEIGDLVKRNIIHAEEYDLWKWDKQLNVLILFQKKNDRPVYFNQNGLILVFLNNKNEMEGYTQTILSKPEKTKSDKKKLIKPIKAVETLYKSNQLNSGDEVKKADLVFYTRVPLRNGVQVFVPTWKIAVNHDKSFFVNAIEGFAIQSDETLFIKSTIQEDIDRLQRSDLNGSLKSKMLALLNQRLNIINRGEDL